jgi:hypothetical protein
MLAVSAFSLVGHAGGQVGHETILQRSGAAPLVVSINEIRRLAADWR